ncbi:hypothetical protein GCM10022214_62410 [Actinomadura miaoliensis]|uniref:Uncharacterized protein n=1 Tax=Actinomadura miaoliensis TaxID=430685 RepID=A0ABP7WNG4_9ACTN
MQVNDAAAVHAKEMRRVRRPPRPVPSREGRETNAKPPVENDGLTPAGRAVRVDGGGGEAAVDRSVAFLVAFRFAAVGPPVPVRRSRRRRDRKTPNRFE